jgi:hypothetical protein
LKATFPEVRIFSGFALDIDYSYKTFTANSLSDGFSNIGGLWSILSIGSIVIKFINDRSLKKKLREQYREE